MRSMSVCEVNAVYEFVIFGIKSDQKIANAPCDESVIAYFDI